MDINNLLNKFWYWYGNKINTGGMWLLPVICVGPSIAILVGGKGLLWDVIGIIWWLAVALFFITGLDRDRDTMIIAGQKKEKVPGPIEV